jgi:hypothetical protein
LVHVFQVEILITWIWDEIKAIWKAWGKHLSRLEMKTIGRKEGQFFPYLVHMGILLHMLGFNLP